MNSDSHKDFALPDLRCDGILALTRRLRHATRRQAGSLGRGEFLYRRSLLRNMLPLVYVEVDHRERLAGRVFRLSTEA